MHVSPRLALIHFFHYGCVLPQTAAWKHGGLKINITSTSDGFEEDRRQHFTKRTRSRLATMILQLCNVLID